MRNLIANNNRRNTGKTSNTSYNIYMTSHLSHLVKENVNENKHSSHNNKLKIYKQVPTTAMYLLSPYYGQMTKLKTEIRT